MIGMGLGGRIVKTDFSFRSNQIRGLLVVGAAIVSSSAFAGWTAYDVNPTAAPPFVQSGIWGLTDSWFVGFHSNLSGSEELGIQWYGFGAGQYNTLSMAGTGGTFGEATCTDGFQIGGGVWDVSGNVMATLWYGGYSNPVLLHPATASSSYIRAVYSSRQVGFAVIGGNRHAAYWEYPGGVFRDLHQNRNRFRISNANTIFGDVIGGYIGQSTSSRYAAIWAGARRRLSTVHPNGYAYSEIKGLYADAYVGLANSAGNDHAYIWSPLGGGYDIHQPSWVSSFATGIDEDKVSVTADYNAWIFDRYNSFTPWENLDAILDAQFPGEYIGSYAACIWRDASSNVTLVGGWGLLPSGLGKAIVWKYVP